MDKQTQDAGADFLEHFGVKGMKWGVRKELPPGVSSHKTNKEARRDAEESARARLFYGQGAGTRRKLINTKVEDRKKKDKEYAKAFDYHLKNQDLSKHSDKAVSERNSIDRKDRFTKRAGYVARKFTGEMGTQAAFTAVALSGAAFVSSQKGRQIMNQGYKSAKDFMNSRQAQATVSYLEDYFKNQ